MRLNPVIPCSSVAVVRLFNERTRVVFNGIEYWVTTEIVVTSDTMFDEVNVVSKKVVSLKVSTK